MQKKKIDIINRIDLECRSIHGARNGTPRYAALVAECAREKDKEKSAKLLEHGVVEMAADTYFAKTDGNIELLMLEDRDINFLFDYKYERTVLAYGATRTVEANSRDKRYHAGYPVKSGYERGHMFAHAQGGYEGGPNYFYQRAALNRGLSSRGKLWRAIETHLSANAGLFAFVRLVYGPNDKWEPPQYAEYGFMSSSGQFRAVVFKN